MNVVAAGSGNVNDTRRRPATVAVAVCIGSYARSIFVMVMFKAGEARGRKNTNVPGNEKKHKGKERAIDTCSTINVSSTTHNRDNQWAPLGLGPELRQNISKWMVGASGL